MVVESSRSIQIHSLTFECLFPAPAQSPLSDLDSPNFDAQSYLRHVLETKTMEEIAKLDQDLRQGQLPPFLISQIRELPHY